MLRKAGVPLAAHLFYPKIGRLIPRQPYFAGLARVRDGREAMALTTWNASTTGSTVALSNANLTATRTATTPTWDSTIASGSGKTSGKWYWRIKFVLPSNSDFVGGAIATSAEPYNGIIIGSDANGWTLYGTPGGGVNVWNNGTFTSGFPTYQASGDYVVIAYDATNGGIYFTTMTAAGVLNTSWNNSSANPSAGSGGISVTAGTALLPAASLWNDINLTATLDTTAAINDSTLSGFLPYDSVAVGASSAFKPYFLDDDDEMPKVNNFLSLGGGTGTFPTHGGVSYISWVNGGSGSVTLTMPNGSSVTTTLPSGMYPISATAVTANTMQEVIGYW